MRKAAEKATSSSETPLTGPTSNLFTSVELSDDSKPSTSKEVSSKNNGPSTTEEPQKNEEKDDDDDDNDDDNDEDSDSDGDSDVDEDHCKLCNVQFSTQNVS